VSEVVDILNVPNQRLADLVLFNVLLGHRCGPAFDVKTNSIPLWQIIEFGGEIELFYDGTMGSEQTCSSRDCFLRTRPIHRSHNGFGNGKTCVSDSSETRLFILVVFESKAMGQ
jgi:hypothetical protein